MWQTIDDDEIKVKTVDKLIRLIRKDGWNRRTRWTIIKEIANLYNCLVMIERCNFDE